MRRPKREARVLAVLEKALDTLSVFHTTLARAVALLEDRDRTIVSLRASLDARNYGESPVAEALRCLPEEDCYRA